LLTNAEDTKELASVASEIVSRNSNAFVNMIVARHGIVCDSGVEEATKLIRNVSKMSNNGFDNFRVGVSCNCEPHTPYFPFSYHEL
jgi:hypothetical protein